MKRIIAIGFFLLLLSYLPAYTDQTFVWTDEKGETHYSKTKPPGWETKKYEENETPEMARARQQRETEEARRDFQIKKTEAEERQKKLEVEANKKQQELAKKEREKEQRAKAIEEHNKKVNDIWKDTLDRLDKDDMRRKIDDIWLDRLRY
jgi:flagellar biosynthesis GTPase FlhF